jgi:AcrR family transcriptional regulator
VTSTGGRGARDRILQAARELFYHQGINATGIEQLAGAAHVSKRTLYQHFPSKDDLVAAYVRGFHEQGRTAPASLLLESGQPPRERLLAVFDLLVGQGAPPGCPFLKASAEIADPQHPARLIAATSKRDLIAALSTLARAAGAADPDTLARRLALLFDGAQAQGVALNSREPGREARALAAELVDRATA